MNQQSKVLLLLLSISLPPSDGAFSFIGGVQSITVLKGASSQSLTWTYQGTDQYFRGVGWTTFIPRTSRQSSDLTKIFQIDRNGDRVTSVNEPSYNNRLSATMSGGNYVSLVISSIKLDDANVYYCHLVSVSGNVDGPAIHLEVGDPPAITMSNSQTCKRGDSQCTLTCSVTGSPQPTITWTRKDKTAVLSNQADYVISSVQTSADGLCTCKAANKHGTTQQDIDLVIQYFDFDSSTSSGLTKTWNGHETQLTCVASGEPTPTFEWWNYNGNPTTQGVSSPQPGTSVLTFTPQQGTGYGYYTCRATNNAGLKEYKIQVTQINLPGSPSVTNIDPATYSIKVTWSPPGNDGGSPVTKYTINVAKVSENTWTSHDVTDPNLRTNSVAGLERNTEYKIRVSAWNIAGQGAKSGEVTAYTLYVGPPDSPPILNTETQLTNNILTLRWSEPSDGGFRITKYSVEIKKNNTYKDPQTKEVSGETVETEVELFWDSTNVVTVFAHNEKGRSTPGENSLTEFTVGPGALSCWISCVNHEESKRHLSCKSSQNVKQYECMNVKKLEGRQLLSDSALILHDDDEWTCRGKETYTWSGWSRVVNNDCKQVNCQSCWSALIGVSSTLGLLVLLFVVSLVYLRYKSPTCFKQQTQKQHLESAPTGTSNQTSGHTNDTFYMELQAPASTSGHPQTENEFVQSTPVSSTSSAVQSTTPAIYEPLRSTSSQLSDPQTSVPNTTYEQLKSGTKYPRIYAQLNQEGVYDNSPSNLRI